MKKIKIAISIIWFIFAVLFFGLGFHHWNASKQNIPPFGVSERQWSNMGSAKILGTDIDQPIKDFAKDFNSFLNGYNNSSKKQNQRSAFGYWLAGLTAIISMLLEWKNK